MPTSVISGAIQLLHGVMGSGGGGGDIQISADQHYEGVRSNVIIIMRGWVGVQLSEINVVEVF